MQKKYQIFVSSTFRDLAEERQDTIRSILDLGHIPAGMELFPATDIEQLTYIKKVIDECDYYILILGGRYGSLDEEGVSFTEREYDYAVETGKLVLAFVHGDASIIPVGKSDTAPRLVAALNEFRAKVMSGRLVREWKSRESLEAQVVKSLSRAIADYPAVGWMRANTAASEELLTQLNDLRIALDAAKQENKKLQVATAPDFGNLASGDENMEVRFKYLDRSRNTSPTHRTKEFSLSWDEMFLAVARDLTIPKSSGLIGSSIVKHIKENKGWSTNYTMLDTDQAIIKNQLFALGLLRVYVGKTLGDGRAHEFMELTPLGRRKLAEALAVKAVPGESA